MDNDTQQKAKEKIILGIDPGTQVMGYGIILIKKQPQVLQFGILHLKKYEEHALKLKKIFERISQIIEEYAPDEVALEAPFMGNNPQSMLKLGRAQGVAMSAALAKEIPVVEYSPKKVKKSVTGNGNASKEQVADMLKRILNFQDTPKLLDATDALAVALCHQFSMKLGVTSSKGGSSWKSFVTNNPKRIKNN